MRRRSPRIPSPIAAAAAALVLCALAGCAAPIPSPPPPAQPGLTELLEQPAERALYDALRAYDDGQYAVAEAALRRALGGGLRSDRDLATTHKLLAFITCTSDRLPECEAAFRAARAADARFDLSRSEAGHPIWGPVWKRIAQPR